jgi:hypothetical protein
VNAVDALVRVYPRSWRVRHEDEFRDALALTADPSGSVPWREVRSAVAGGLRERARGESQTPRELVRDALRDSYIFVSGLIVGFCLAGLLRSGFPSPWYPAVFAVFPVAVFVSSMFTMKLTRWVIAVLMPVFWLTINVVALRIVGSEASGIQFARGVAYLAPYGATAFLGLAFVLRRRFALAGVAFAPTLVGAFLGLVETWRRKTEWVVGTPSPNVRTWWSLAHLAFVLTMTGVAFVVLRNATTRRGIRPIHAFALVCGLSAVIAPLAVTLMTGAVVLLLAWWNPRPALTVLTWPVAFYAINWVSMLTFDGGRRAQLVWLLPTAGAVVVALFLRHTAKRVHRLG